MSISSIGGSSNIDVAAVKRATATDAASESVGSSSATKDSFRNDFGSLLAAIQSGDISTAQSALASLKSVVGSSGAGYSQSGTTTPVSGVGSDLQSMFDAVGSGDISSAQSALSSFVMDVTSSTQNGSPAQSANSGSTPRAHGHGGHHHHNHGLEQVIGSLFANDSSAAGTQSSDGDQTASAATNS